MPWLRILVTGLSPGRPGFDSGLVHVFNVVESVTGTYSSSSAFVFLYPYHAKKINNNVRLNMLIMFYTVESLRSSLLMSTRICIPIHDKRTYRCGPSKFINWYCITWHLLCSSTLPLCPIYHHHHHHHHQSVMELGHLLTRSGLMYPEVSLTVCHDFFCQLGNIVS